MVSVEFLYFFLPVFMGLYVVVSPKHRGKILLLGTLLLVSWVDILGVIPLFVSALTTYLTTIGIDNHRENKKAKNIYFVLSLVVNICIFILFAYSEYDKTDLLGGFTSNGISLNFMYAFGVVSYVMHSVSYTIDIYKEKYRCEHSFCLVAEYIGFFPVMPAGPFVRFNDISNTLHNPLVTSEKLAEGIKLLLIGMLEKLILSNSMYEIWTSIQETDSMSLSVTTSWIGMAGFSFFFYFELSAFSNIGRGLSLMLGFEIEKNFDSPFMSVSFTEFLTKFNISVTSFVKEYVYQNIFKDKNKKSIKLLIITIVATIITALWYGFGVRAILWCLIIVMMVYLENLFKKPLASIPNAIRCVGFNFLYVILLPVLAFPKLSDSMGYLLAMFGINSGSVDVMTTYIISTSSIIFILSFLFSTNIFPYFKKKILAVNESILTVIEPVYVTALLLLVTAFLISENSSLLALLY